MAWKPIHEMVRDKDGISKARHGVVVGWWINLGGKSWETSTDELTPGATHYIELERPPA